ncbi:MAG: hypothetical protein AVDCRST_MAG19-1759 [uncultured Thermomicrobiales bacterium]|uniref:Aminoglycoside phosphotransferase domain-containing protein n=1 Tax=uncultured Thermomicrobiales bacterium TaxID=1645740 RepID=A0A6J4UX51_9BACT|nr:MAG: hypothetical protein AVDCRST_MAG19-1759 [uncultured Thermomicrobiales bacterium]
MSGRGRRRAEEARTGGDGRGRPRSARGPQHRGPAGPGHRTGRRGAGAGRGLDAGLPRPTGPPWRRDLLSAGRRGVGGEPRPGGAGPPPAAGARGAGAGGRRLRPARCHARPLGDGDDRGAGRPACPDRRGRRSPVGPSSGGARPGPDQRSRRRRLRLDQAGRLAAVLSTHHAFALREPPERLHRLRGVLRDDTVRAIRRAVADRDAWIGAEQARLAHGDLDATHDFQHEGRYAGIIDFGEIRGADRHDALGHFALHEGKTLPRPVLPFLLEGYRDVVPRSAEEERRLHLWAVLIGVQALAQSLDHPRGAYPEHLTGVIRRNLAILRARDGARPPGSPRPPAHAPPARNASPPSRV